MALENDPHVSREGSWFSRTTPSLGPDYFASCEHTICHSKISFVSKGVWSVRAAWLSVKVAVMVICGLEPFPLATRDGLGASHGHSGAE